MKLEKLAYFIDLYETRSYTKTARKNYISQTSVTQFINALEEELQVRLFDRTTLPIQPTEAGKRFYQDAKLLLGQYERIKRDLLRMEQAEAEPIRICYTSAIDLQILLPFVNQFKHRHPEARFEVFWASFKDASQVLWVDKCDAVIGIDFDEAYTGNLRTLVLYRGEYQALVPAGHPLFERPTLTKAELYRYPLVMMAPEVIGQSYDGMIQHALQDGYYPHIQRTADNFSSELFLILTENLIGFAPDNYDLREYEGRMRRIPIEESHHQFHLEMKYRAGENTALARFVEELESYLKNE